VAAAAAANGTAGGAGGQQSNIENLLDIDFDGAAPASAEQNPAGTPDRVASPVTPGGSVAPPSGGMADIMGLFDAPTPAAAPVAGAGAGMGAAPVGGGGMNDLMGGFAEMDLSGTSAPPPPGQQLGHGNGKAAAQSKGSDDLLGLF
jgi:hypothetical protein